MGGLPGSAVGAPVAVAVPAPSSPARAPAGVAVVGVRPASTGREIILGGVAGRGSPFTHGSETQVLASSWAATNNYFNHLRIIFLMQIFLWSVKENTISKALSYSDFFQT